MMVTISLGKLRLVMHKKSPNSSDSGQIILVVEEFIEFDQNSSRSKIVCLMVKTAHYREP